MDPLSARNFGLLIAYVIPGFLMLFGCSWPSESVRLWLLGTADAGPAVSGFLYVLLGSVGLGMTASVIRWACLDSLHERTGVRRPKWDESQLTNHLQAFDYLVESRYRYYQFYGNVLVALPVAYLAWRIGGGVSPLPAGLLELVLLVISGVFAAGSRDVLRKYYAGGLLLLGPAPKERNDDEREPQRRD